MKRRIILSLLLLVAGALINVAVAVGIGGLRGELRALTGDFMLSNKGLYFVLKGPGFCSVFPGCPYSRYIEPAGDEPPPAWVIHADQRARKLENDRTDAIEFRAMGWPLLSMQYHIWIHPTNKYSVDVVGGMRVSDRLSAEPDRIIPMTLMWPGFAINTVFYAVILWVLFTAPLALRKRRRIKRGLCPKCAYDLRGRSPATNSSVCPECGKPVTPRV